MKKREWSWASPVAIAFYVFFILKVANLISWSWFWVFFPLLLGFVILVLNNYLARYYNDDDN